MLGEKASRRVVPPSVTTSEENKWRQAGLAPGVPRRRPPVRPGPSLLPALPFGSVGPARGSATESRAGRPPGDGKAWECLG